LSKISGSSYLIPSLSRDCLEKFNCSFRPHPTESKYFNYQGKCKIAGFAELNYKARALCRIVAATVLTSADSLRRKIIFALIGFRNKTVKNNKPWGVEQLPFFKQPANRIRIKPPPLTNFQRIIEKLIFQAVKPLRKRFTKTINS
jgi:hypothetical protein